MGFLNNFFGRGQHASPDEPNILDQEREHKAEMVQLRLKRQMEEADSLAEKLISTPNSYAIVPDSHGGSTLITSSHSPEDGTLEGVSFEKYDHKTTDLPGGEQLTVGEQGVDVRHLTDKCREALLEQKETPANRSVDRGLAD